MHVQTQTDHNMSKREKLRERRDHKSYTVWKILHIIVTSDPPTQSESSFNSYQVEFTRPPCPYPVRVLQADDSPDPLSNYLSITNALFKLFNDFQGHSFLASFSEPVPDFLCLFWCVRRQPVRIRQPKKLEDPAQAAVANKGTGRGWGT